MLCIIMFVTPLSVNQPEQYTKDNVELILYVVTKRETEEASADCCSVVLDLS